MSTLKMFNKKHKESAYRKFSLVLVETESLSSHALWIGVQTGDITLKSHLELPAVGAYIMEPNTTSI